MKINSSTDVKEFNRVKTYLEKLGLFHTLEISNYTVSLKWSDNTLTFADNNFLNKTFAASKKIQGDIKDYTANEVPLKDETHPVYYDYNLKDLKKEKVWNIDISGAYPKTLLNEGWVNKNTYDFLLSLPKLERLASIGMMASRKTIFKYQGSSILEDSETVEGPYPGVFFRVCEVVGEIMTKCREITGNNFLFFWVDGIFFLPDEKIKKDIYSFLSEKQYSSKFEEIQKLIVQEKKTSFKVDYLKNSERKSFYIGKKNNQFFDFICNKYLK